MLSVKFYGVRGSFPSPGSRTSKTGGNTSCVVIKNLDADLDDATLVFDLGSGAVRFSEEVYDSSSKKFYAFLSHLHWDHIQGLPFMSLLDREDCILNIYSPPTYAPLEDFLSQIMSPPLFPVALKERAAQIRFFEMSPNRPLQVGESGLSVSGQAIDHSDPVLGYKVSYEGTSIAYITDHQCSADPTVIGDSVLNLCFRADLIIHDAQYTQDEFLAKANWGHSTYEFAVNLARLSQAKRLAFFHHDPNRSDSELEDIVGRYRDRGYPFEIFAATEGQEVFL